MAASTDRELWMRLHAVLAGRPEFGAEEPAGSNTAPTGGPRMVRQIDLLADHLSMALLPPWEPVPPGTARDVARWVEGVCRSFVRYWSPYPAPTNARLREFQRDVQCLMSILDGAASSALCRIDGPGATPEPDRAEPASS